MTENTLTIPLSIQLAIQMAVQIAQTICLIAAIIFMSLKTYNFLVEKKRFGFGTIITAFAIVFFFLNDMVNATLKSVEDQIFSTLTGSFFRGTAFGYQPFFLTLTRLLPFFILWIIISMMINGIIMDYTTQKKRHEDEEFSSFISPFFEHPTVAGLLTVAIFLFSFYLVLASIIAVPELQVVNNETDNRQKLLDDFEKSLDNIRLEYTSINWSAAKIDSLPNASDNSEQTKENLKELLNVIERNIRNLNLSLKSIKSQASENYRVAINSEHLSSNNLNQYSNLLTSQIASSFKRLSLLEAQITNLNEFASSYKKYPRTFYVPTYEGVDYTGNILLKSPPVPSERLGSLAFSFRWLIDPGNPSLVLVMGLVGFGLLGAITSRFVRKGISVKDEVISPFANDVIAIIITGVTAAIIVFLAVKGSVAIFTNNSNNIDLNPYGIFFLCFASSVFSEQAWLWARRRYIQSLAEVDTRTGEKPNIPTSNLTSDKTAEMLAKSGLVDPPKPDDTVWWT